MLKTHLRQWWSRRHSALHLIRSSSLAGLLRIVAAICTFGLTIVLGHALGAEGTGLYFLAYTTATIVAIVGRLGLDNVLLRFVAAGSSAEQWAEVRSGFRATLTVGLIGSCVVATALYCAADVLAESAFSHAGLAVPMRVMAVAIVPFSLGLLVSKGLLGLSRVTDSVLVLSIIPPGVALLGTAALAPRLGVQGATAAYVIATSVALLYGWMVWRRELAGRTPGRPSETAPSPLAGLLRAGRPLLVGDLLYVVMQTSSTLMLGIWADPVDVSHYGVAWRTAALVGFAPLAVSMTVQPKFAALYARREMQALAVTTRKALLLMLLCATPVLVGLLVLPNLVMSIFGSEFAESGTILQILALGQFMNIGVVSAGILLVMAGHERQFRNVLIVSVCLVLLLNAVFIPRYGAIGAAIAETTGLLIQNTLFAYVVWTRLGILMGSSRLRPQPTGGDEKETL